MGSEKLVSEMTRSELEQYKHSPETELTALVCQACESGDFSLLTDYLRILWDTDPQRVNATDKAGMTALHFAVSCQNIAAVKILMTYGGLASVHIQDALGFTPLFLATGRYPSVEISKYLIEQGKADINLKTLTGATPLHGAALQGNIDCIRLLLLKHADPRVEDEDGTIPMELAKDDASRTLLHDAVIDADSKRDAVDAVCAQCKQIPKDGLKRCGQCHVTLYCSRDCQLKHWKFGGHRSNCTGYVMARPFHYGEKAGEGFHTSFYRVMGSTKSDVKVYVRNANEAAQKMAFLTNKRFVVKVQVPIGASSGEMMVYNADRSVEGYVYHTERGYENLTKRIQTEGFMGVKAFFWAEIMTGIDEGCFKIFHGKCAPYQQW
ncbi:nuclear factor NF-kappa-B p100 subunit-like [Mytilus californianus]|uniref:nuclear factor NF-kappa-B p100 subunit-like n=1 Tax=Mytilus californianus TaxID=6549 RepID=UPI002246A0B6|nr:nuclear factor NF-kappa-B p100 subunit-like [Mytilus californianus]